MKFNTSQQRDKGILLYLQETVTKYKCNIPGGYLPMNKEAKNKSQGPNLLLKPRPRERRLREPPSRGPHLNLWRRLCARRDLGQKALDKCNYLFSS